MECDLIQYIDIYFLTLYLYNGMTVERTITEQNAAKLQHFEQWMDAIL
jgi:hypothetical protein